MREVVTYTQPIITRAMAAKRGEKYEWRGQMKDPRYAFKTETLRSWLGALITPDLEAQLAALGSPKTLEERQATEKVRLATFEKARKPRSRAQEGRYSQARHEYKAKAAGRAQQAQELRENGLLLQAIATELQVSERQIKRYLKRGTSAPHSCIAPAGGS